ncbi:MAG: hypothetical protein O3A79_05250 [Candidatus Marinimicrobia bacterium]|nr:hypothetical protein [Candidatus Neomarinimicrobiota bacterium]
MLNTSSEMISNMLSEEDVTLKDVQKEFDNRQHLVDFIASYDDLNTSDNITNELISALKKRFVDTSQVIKIQLENLQARNKSELESISKQRQAIQSYQQSLMA